MNGSLLFWFRLSVLSLCCLSASAAWGQESKERTDRLPSLTHLNGTSQQIVYLRTNCVQNTSPENESQPFFYDGGNLTFQQVPKGFSFVITDIIIDGTFCARSVDRLFVIVEFGHSGVGSRALGRRFVAALTGETVHHYALAGGLVVTEGAMLTATNTVFSTGGVFVQVLGYFVRGPGLQEFQRFPFPEDEKSVPEDEKSDN